MAGIYIHIPYCKLACYYCDFHFSASLMKKKEMVQALVKELQLRKDELKVPIETIYFGGGTPSLLTIDEIQVLLNTVYDNFLVSADPEITLEANPDDLNSEKIFQLSQTNINRLSIGIQSFHDKDLQLMNRAHHAQEALDCIKEAKKYFENISIDLIYGIPGLTYEQWQKNLEIAIDFNVPHISSYALTVEPKTALEKFIRVGKIPPVEEKQSKEHYLILLDRMEASGFINYEFSNFGKEGYFSKNNTAYWNGKSYLGIGPSAHSFNGTTRSWNVRNNTQYIKSLAIDQLPSEKETLNVSDSYNEYIMTGLRTMWGVSLDKVEKDFGPQYKSYCLEQLKEPLQNELIEVKNNILTVTKKGKFLSDGIASNLFWVD